MKIMNKKAQSAMEYLMTYGWAILVVLIALGALFYLGVFSPKTPNSCVGVAPISCTDVKATGSASGGSDTLILTLGASGATGGIGSYTVNGISNVTLASLLPGTCTWPSPITISTLTPTAQTLSCTDAGNALPLVKGNKFSGTMDVTYTLTGSTTTHITTVQFSGTVE